MQPSLLLATAAKKTANMLKNAADSEKTRGLNWEDGVADNETADGCSFFKCQVLFLVDASVINKKRNKESREKKKKKNRKRNKKKKKWWKYFLKILKIIKK